MIEVTQLAARRGDQFIFKNLSFCLQRGELILLVGGNGAGKTTLLNILAGLLSPAAGSVNRENLEPERSQLAYLGHRPAVYPGLSALENLAFWNRAAGLGLTEAELLNSLASFGLRRLAHERAGTFSRGMTQRLALARVFLGQPLIILLDEPSAALDSQGVQMLISCIEQARKGGACILLATHDLQVFASFCSRVLYLRKGREAWLGPANASSAMIRERQCCV